MKAGGESGWKLERNA